MRKIGANDIENTVYRLFLSAAKKPAPDVIAALKKAYEEETGKAPKKVLAQLLQNLEVCDHSALPSCQDTGMAVVFIDIGQTVMVEGDIDAAINQGVKRAYADGYYRKSVLSPLERQNTGDNTPAVIHKDIIAGEHIKISVMAKGFGSENMSMLRMMKPSDGVAGIKALVAEAVNAAGGSPCPPVILGVGIGGTMEKAAIMAKRQLLRDLNDLNEDTALAALEAELRGIANSQGMGAMGFPGDIYCLGVKIGTFPTHLAGMPAAINFNCHAARHASAEI